jgi:uncharacterized protein with HEPN domain
MSSPRDDLVYVEDMLLRIRRVLHKTESVTWERFEHDEDLHDIAERGISVVGEAARKVSETFRAAHPEIPWTEVMGIRHKIVHDYFEVNYTILWSVIREELPALERLLAHALEGARG